MATCDHAETLPIPDPPPSSSALNIYAKQYCGVKFQRKIKSSKKWITQTTLGSRLLETAFEKINGNGWKNLEIFKHKHCIHEPRIFECRCDVGTCLSAALPWYELCTIYYLQLSKTTAQKIGQVLISSPLGSTEVGEQALHRPIIFSLSPFQCLKNQMHLHSTRQKMTK